MAEKMTPAAVELAIETRREVEARYEEADQLRCRAIERAQVDADLAQRRFMMVDPQNRLVADTLESDWNEKLRVLQKAREERERARRADEIAIDGAVHDRLVAMTTDFTRLWSDSSTPNRERKRMLAYVVEDVTLVKVPADGTTKIHVRFRGGQTTTLTTVNPKASWEMVKTPAEVVALVDRLLDDHVYEGIAEILNARGLHPGGAAWPGRGGDCFTGRRVQYLVHTYDLRPRLERLRARGLLTKKELSDRLGIHASTLTSWVKHGIIKAHAYNGHAWLYEEPATRPTKHCSRWDRLSDRAAATEPRPRSSSGTEGGVVCRRVVVEKGVAVAVPPKGLEPVAPAVDEQEQRSARRVQAQHLSSHRRELVERPAQIRRTERQVNCDRPHDHRPLRSAWMVSTTSEIASPEAWTRVPSGRSTLSRGRQASTRGPPTTSGISESAVPLAAEAVGDCDAALPFSIQRRAVTSRTPSSVAISAAPTPPRTRSAV